jgi:nitroreductase/dihydropteridine reductase
MDLMQALKQRYTTKAYDAERRIPEDVVAKLKDALRLSPSSINSQPWHFLIADTAEGKARIAKSAHGGFAYNAPKITDASHVFVLCARTKLTPEYVDVVLDQEQADGRFASGAEREGREKSCKGYVALHERLGNTAAWAQNQTYISLGFLLLAAGELGIDATPIEGFDKAVLTEEFKLAGQDLAPAVVVSLGYHAETDFNAGLPKSRLPESAVFSSI